ncbi:MAG: hypothetical protein LR015_04455 [Verrucomicrobia bacterium]|nr:hypothetical protein [Verrucomicrobiota bacterium]
MLKIDTEKGVVDIGVRDFAEFGWSLSGGGPSSGGLWRMELGRQWHNTLADRARESLAEGEQLHIEWPIQAVVVREGWQIRFSGRIDQLLVQSDGRKVVREIKSVDRPLPEDEDTLLKDYVVYMRQLALYLELFPLSDKSHGKLIQGELILVDISSGVVQTLFPSEHPQVLLEPIWHHLLSFVEARRKTLKLRRSLVVASPFNAWRQGQETFRDDLFASATRAQVLALQAPTGFGKTGILLEYALTGLRDGLWDRILYLSGKTTGQLPVVNQLKSMLHDTCSVPVMHIRSQQEMRADLNFSAEDLRDEIQNQRWQDSGLSIEYLMRAGVPSHAELRELSHKFGLDPYRLSLMLLPYCDLWLGDYNYVFGPGSKHVFF